MKSKKIVSIIASLCLMLTCFISFGTNIYALTEDERQTVTVTGFKAGEETTVKVYKVGNVELDGDVVAIDSLTWSDEVKEWVRTNYSNYIEGDNLITKGFQNLTVKDDIDKFWQDMEDDVLKGDLNLTASVNETTTDTSIRNKLGMGVYLLSISAPETIYSTVSFNVFPKLIGNDWDLDNFQTVNVKKQDVSIGKEITDDDFTSPSNENETVGVGSVIPYKVNTVIPTYEANTIEDTVVFCISDTMSTGLNFNKDIKVYGNSELTDALTKDTDYVVEEESDKRFKLKLNWSYLKTHQKQGLYVTYTATVTEEAIKESEIPNYVELEYSNKQDISKKHDVEKAYTYNISFDKVDTSDSLLKNAQFNLKDATTSQPIKVKELTDGEYVVDPTSANTTIKSSTGKFKINGLDTGSYILEETKAPDGGYVLPSGGMVNIVLVDNEPDGNLDSGTNATGTAIEIKDSTINGLNFGFKVVNKKADELKLPVTGGAGTLMFTVGGISIMGVAVLLYTMNRRKRNV